MSLLAQFEAPTEAGDRRRADRRPLMLGISATVPNDPQLAANIHDLSETGFLLETQAQLAADQLFQVFLPLAGAVEARVVWTSAHFYGCQFREPVARGAVSAALLKSVPSEPAANVEADPELDYYDALPAGAGDTVKWAVIASLTLAGLATLMLIAALLGIA